jgi:hypothetical protein
MYILTMLVGLAMLVVYVMVLIKLFQNAGALHGILGIICGLYTFIWGWMNSGKLNIRNLMIIWTVLIIVYSILAATTGAMNFNYGVNTGVTP